MPKDILDTLIDAGLQMAGREVPPASTKPTKPALTLRDGALPAAFKRLTLPARIDADTRADVADRAILKDFPDLKKLEGEALGDHPDYPVYNNRAFWHARRFPYLIAAWAGEGALTVADIEASTDAEVHACMVEMRRLHPHLPQFPAPPAARGDADPNA